MDEEKLTVSKEEFEARYAEKSGVTREWLAANMVAVPCDCGEDGCKGWKMVTRSVYEFETK